MRHGDKPTEVLSTLPVFLRHRVIIPVYVPNLQGYYKDALEILSLCLKSLHYTSTGRASVTVVSNNACKETRELLERYLEAGWLDQIVMNRCNRGKVDAVLSTARGAFEDFVTFSDCDVLFMPGWLEAVEEIFRSFPECGFASPAPNPRSAWYHTSATILGGLVGGELGFDKVVPERDMDRFEASIAWPGMFEQDHRRSQMILSRNSATACVGAGHFVATLNKSAVARLPKEPCRIFSRGSEENWIDLPLDAAGFWRLSTTRAYAHHMGNLPEAWMREELEAMRDTEAPASETEPIPTAGRPWTRRAPVLLRRKIAGAYRLGINRFGRPGRPRR